MAVLSIHAPGDHLLAAVAPLGLAAVAGTALVVDLDPEGPPYPGPGSLASLVRSGPRRSDLRASRPGLAVLRNGGAEQESAREVVEALLEGWPAVVLRLAGPEPWLARVPVVPVFPLLPGILSAPAVARAVYQQTSLPAPAPAGGIVLPRPSPRVMASLLRGIAPGPSRWIRAWREVWDWA